MSELYRWWQDVLDDLEPETTTFTLTLSRAMAEETTDAASRFASLTSPETLEKAEAELMAWMPDVFGPMLAEGAVKVVLRSVEEGTQ